MYCNHPNMKDTARYDYCPYCGYTYYYGDAHSPNEQDRISKCLDEGRDEQESNKQSNKEEEDV